jgi:2-dehydro-3-deoxygalactonokinase
VDLDSLLVLAEISNSEGCARTNEGWLKTGGDEKGRLEYYSKILYGHIQELQQKSGMSTTHLPLVISGMASSTIGMVNLPYKEVPVLADGSDLRVEIVEETASAPHKTFIISGVRTGDDVMRGEETKLVGCLGSNSDKEILVLPGTHPKHVFVDQNRVTGFKTFMTGEFFELLSTKSILALSVKKSSEPNVNSFADGVKEGKSGNLLHSSFLVRTNALFEKYSQEQNFDFLSGLLIGSELKDVMNVNCPITLLGAGKLAKLYEQAFEVLQIPLARQVNADEALLKGQQKVLRNLL